MSVIVDTGSAHTAFPCQGCKCGKHMDPFFDPAKSNTSSILKCNGKKRCEFKQGYTEGSSWTAYRVKDALWMGEPALKDNVRASQLQTSFEFGCLTSETGLFRTQNVDGIMGMSIASETLPQQLTREGVIPSPAFSMCFRIGGGLLTLGGADSRLHVEGPSGRMSFARLTKDKGWFTVKLIDVLLKNAASGKLQTIGVAADTFNTGKGAIVDSGTTDTYLPASSKKNFDKVFQAVAGRKYQANAPMKLSQSELLALPSIVYRIQGANGTIDVESPPTAYSEKLPNGQYAFRVYLTEGRGSVLGANFMDGHNVLFDAHNKRIGFARSTCELTAVSGAARSDEPPARLASAQPANPCEAQLLSACTVQCPRLLGQQRLVRVEGKQVWSLRSGAVACGAPADTDTVTEPCYTWCSKTGRPSRSNATCSSSAWTSCSASCTQSRSVPPSSSSSSSPDECESTSTQRRECLSGDCPLRAGDVVVTLDLRLPALKSTDWCDEKETDLIRGLAAASGAAEEQLHLVGPVPMARASVRGIRLQVKVRVGAAAGAGAAQALLQQARSGGFMQAVAERVNGVATDSGEGRWLVASEMTLHNSFASRPAREEGSLQEEVSRLFGQGRSKRNGTAYTRLRYNATDIFYRSDTLGSAHSAAPTAATAAGDGGELAYGYWLALAGGTIVLALLLACCVYRGYCTSGKYKSSARTKRTASRV